jgi:hypothetical protein
VRTASLTRNSTGQPDLPTSRNLAQDSRPTLQSPGIRANAKHRRWPLSSTPQRDGERAADKWGASWDVLTMPLPRRSAPHDTRPEMVWRTGGTQSVAT